MSLKLRLESKMDELGYKPSNIADGVNVKVQAVYKWLNGGTISMENAIKLAEFLDVEAAWLIFGADAEQLKAEPVDLEKLTRMIKTLPAHYQQIISDIAEALSNKYGSDEN
ncbi:helix-turn-helix transcriptional regulator [Candidatus Albibeggiatoa sp. nov. BB20]|uniref:helix-turn-helix domain-containing protein n=1 Tax=Candidatus Albibeggiatoa sp. nov. BB20 TaxID=3162723 RepID=UPI00336580F5